MWAIRREYSKHFLATCTRNIRFFDRRDCRFFYELLSFVDRVSWSIFTRTQHPAKDRVTEAADGRQREFACQLFILMQSAKENLSFLESHENARNFLLA